MATFASAARRHAPRTTWVAACAVLAIGCASTPEVIAPSTTMTGLGKGVRVEQLAPGVWLHQTDKLLGTGMRVPANGLLVADGDGGILIDTGWNAEQTSTLLAWAKELGHPVHTVVVTHAHDDRMGGLPAAQQQGIRTVGHPLTRELGLRLFEFGPEPLEELTAGTPVPLGPVELLHPGPGHSRDNLVVYVPSANLLFAGCLVKDVRARSLGYTGDADLERWPAAIEAVQAAYPAPERVVPGHGNVGDAALLPHTLQVLATVGR